MPRYAHKDLPLNKSEISKAKFKQKKPARIGSKKSPAQISVQTEERKLELLAVFKENKWNCEIKIDAKQDENILDLEFLQNKQPSKVLEKTPNRNDPCSCGSKKKYKVCCGA